MKTITIQPTLLAVALILCIDGVAQNTVFAQHPANDHFQNVQAQVLPLGSAVIFSNDNTGATIDNDFLPGSVADVNWGVASVWHAITLTEPADVVVDLCGTNFAQPGAFADYLFPDSPDVDQVIEATSLYPSPCSDGNYAMTFTDLAPGTYFMAVGDIPGIAEGNYSLTVSASAPGASGLMVKPDLSVR